MYNKFGERRVYFDRIDSCFTEALAWIPQSTVAHNALQGAMQLEEQCEGVEILLNVHDSVVFQARHNYPLDRIKKALEVVTPYSDPLVIPWDIKLSRKSWGDVAKEGLVDK